MFSKVERGEKRRLAAIKNKNPFMRVRGLTFPEWTIRDGMFHITKGFLGLLFFID